MLRSLTHWQPGSPHSPSSEASLLLLTVRILRERTEDSLVRQPPLDA